MLLLLLVAAGFATITPELERHMATAQTGARLPVHVVLKEQFDAGLLNQLVDGMPRAQRRVEVARILQDFSAGQQQALLAWLEAEQAQGTVADVRPLWIINAVYCEATPEVIEALSQRAEVNYVNYDLAYAPDLLEPEEPTDGQDEIAWGVERVNAPAVWSQGYTGQGIICGHIDTGCNYTHPDLADHMWTDPNYPNHGWNFENNNNDPNDAQGHGTHTAGSVASDGTSGSQCGVAPDAQIMVCRVRTTADSVAESQCWQAMQFCVAPPLSPANGADLYTMSLGWQISWNPHQATWRQTADNVNAAGLCQIVAAGNERSLSPPNSCRCPGNVPPPWWNPQNTGTGTLSGIMSIGATDASDNYASFSSRGPVTWANVPPYNDYPYPPGLTRPDVSAPGDNIKSCARTGGYTTMSGTSMATPHVAGAVCLMLSKNPALTPAVVDSILEITAVDRGPSGKDNDYGAGRIDALAAVNYVTGSGGPMLILRATTVLDSPPGGNNNGQVDPGEVARLQMTLRNSGGSACNNVTGVFRSTDARLTVTDSTGTWGNIASGGEATNTLDRLEVRAGGTIPPGTVISCTLVVTGDSADYTARLPIALRVGTPPPQPGEIIWGPRVCSNMPTDWGLYGMAYNTNDNLLYAMYFMQPTIYKYSSDSLLTPQGTVTLPEDSCTDLDYCAYDNTFWVVANSSKRVYKITPTGSVVRQFNVPQADYPCGIVEHDDEHLIYLTDRRLSGQTQQRVFVYDTTGAILDTIIHPVSGYYGSRCLALDDRCPVNTPSVLNIFTWFNTGGTAIDSIGMLEIDRVSFTLRNRFKFSNSSWNVRGIEYDPRDGSYWISIMEDQTGGNNRIFKVVGFNYGVGIEESRPAPRSENSRIIVSAWPNPFTRGTVLSVRLAQPGNVDLKVFDNNGRAVRELASARQVSAQASFPWDGRDGSGRSVAPGIYFYRVRSAGAEAWGKVVLSD